MGSVDRQTLVELIEAQKAKLSPEALKLWKELDESHYFSDEADRILSEDFSNEEAIIFTRHQSYQIDILKRFDQMPEEDQRIKDVLVSLRMGLYRSEEAESRGESSQPLRDESVIYAAIIKDRDKWGPGGSMRVEEFEGRTVEQALARLREHSQPEPPDERESPEAPEEATEPAVESPDQPPQARRRAHGAPGGVGCSEGEDSCLARSA